jgi:hypothetical protein
MCASFKIQFFRKAEFTFLARILKRPQRYPLLLQAGCRARELCVV